MQQTFGSIVLVIVSLFFFYTAWSSGFQPEKFAQSLGLGIADPGGYAEIRGQYAGFFFMAAVLCIASLFNVTPRSSAYITLAVIFGGLIVGRLAHLAVQGNFAGFGPTIIALYFIDAAGVALAVTALVTDRPAQ
jgi:Domain of unknown function (DUF4345)